VLIATAPAALAKKPAPKPKPNAELVIARLHVIGPSFVFQNERDPNIHLGDTTLNIGTREAGPSLTKVYLEHDGKRRLLAKREVPRLDPGKRDSDTDLIVPVMDFPLGSYTLEFCADANYRYQHRPYPDQCFKHSTGDFSVIAKAWTGSISGEYDSILGNSETWLAPDTQLVYSGSEGGGIYSYAFVGTVTWIDAGTDEDGCTWSGSGSQSYGPQNPPIGSMSVDYKHEEYTAAFSAARPFYQAAISCPNGGSSTAASPQAIGFFASRQGGPEPLPFGSTTLPGSPNHGLLGSTFNWNLKPAAP